MVIAGHVWASDGRCVCGKSLSDISFAAFDPYWVGQLGVAHSGALTLGEQNEIAGAVERLHATLKGSCENA